MLRRIVSLTALIVVASAYAGGDHNYYTNTGNNICDTGFGNNDKNNNSYCDTTPKDCNPKPNDCNPPTNCVPEPSSIAALAIGGIGFLRRKKKNS